MKYNKYILLFFVLAVITNNSFAHKNDTLTAKNNIYKKKLHTAFFNNMLINPAFTGFYDGHSITTYASVEKPFFKETSLYNPQKWGVAYDFSFGKKNQNAFGVYYEDIKEGFTNGKAAGINYAYVFNLNKSDFYHKLRLGSSFYFRRNVMEWNKLTFGDMIDPQYGLIYNTSEIKFDTIKAYVKFDFGLFYYNPLFYLGLATVNITEPEMSYYGTNPIRKQFDIVAGGHIAKGDYTFHPVLNVNFESYGDLYMKKISPSIMASYKNRLYMGVTYKDLNKIVLTCGGTFLNNFFISAYGGISTNNDIKAFEVPTLAGAQLKFNF